MLTIVAKLEEALEADSLSAHGMLEILQLLYQHLQQPAKKIAYSVTEQRQSTAKVGPSYTLEDVFSDSFSQPKLSLVATLPGQFRESDFLRVFSAYFTVGNIDAYGDDEEATESYQADDESLDREEPEEIGNKKANEEIIKLHEKRRKSEESAQLRKKLISALENVVIAMSSEEFINSRSPERLGADIVATALLLRKGLVDGIIFDEDFADITERLWAILFFGSKGEPGMIEKHLASCPVDESTSFKSTIASPQLTAALTLWCFPDWVGVSTHGIKFRFSAMLLAARLHWLVHGGSDNEIHGELSRLSRTMPLGADFETLIKAWTSWVRAGVAFMEFEKAASSWKPNELAERVTRDHVKRGELLWQVLRQGLVPKGEFCVACADYQRDQNIKAIVRPLTGVKPITFQGDWLVPVTALLSEPKLLSIDEAARSYLFKLVSNWQP